MSAMNSERNPHVVSAVLGTQASTISLPLLYVRKKSRLKALRILDQAGISASNSNYLVMALKDENGVSYAQYDTRAAGQGALTALVGGEAALESTLVDNGEVEIPAGVSLKLVVTATGTVTLTKAVASLEMYSL